MDEENEMEGWAQVENEERHRRESEGLKRAKILREQLSQESEEFGLSQEKFRKFMLDYEQNRRNWS